MTDKQDGRIIKAEFKIYVEIEFKDNGEDCLEGQAFEALDEYLLHHNDVSGNADIVKLEPKE